MAVKGNNSTEKIGAAPKTLYSGLADSKLLIVNPSKEELAKYGVNFETEPNYITEKEGIQNLRLDFWVEPQVSEKVLTKLSLWLSNEKYVGQTSGKTQFINAYGRTGWGMSSSECGQYFQTTDAREALKGEEDLHKLLAAFLNTKYNDKTNEFDECLVDSSKFFKNDYSELRDALRTFNTNTVRLMYGVEVKDDKAYQKVYAKHFERTWAKPDWTKWNSALTGQYSQFKADYQDSFDFQVYDVKPNAPKADAEVTSEKDVF